MSVLWVATVAFNEPRSLSADPPGGAAASADGTRAEAVRRGAVWIDEWLASAARLDISLSRSDGAGDPRLRFAETVLAAYAVLHASPQASLAASRSVVNYIARNWRAGSSTYGTALSLAYIHELARRERSRSGRSDAEPVGLDRPTGDLVTLARDLWQDLARLRTKGGAWNYGLGTSPGDASNTQFGMLGALAASRMGLRVDSALLREVAHEVVTWQISTGVDVDVSMTRASEDRYAEPPVARTGVARARGFAYRRGDRLSVSTTLSALAALACVSRISRQEGAADLGLDIRGAVRDGLAWMQEFGTLGRNTELTRRADVRGVPGELDRSGDYSVDRSNRVYLGYLIWSSERAMALLGVGRLGSTDWTVASSAYLVDSQAKNGSWALWMPGRPDATPGELETLGSGGSSCARMVDTALAVLALCGATRSQFGGLADVGSDPLAGVPELTPK